MDRNKKVTILLPALNEEQGIGSVIRDIPVDTLHKLGVEVDIIVVDGGSTDHTHKIAIHDGARVIICPRKGKGNQIGYAQAGIFFDKVFQGNDTDYIIMLDSDGSYPPEYITQIVKMLMADSCDVISGYRIKNSNNMQLSHRLFNWGITLLANILYPIKTKDLCTGYWGFTRSAFEQIKITAKGFDLEANLFTEVNRLKFRFEQIPINYMPRLGKSHIRPYHALSIIKKLITEFRYGR